MSIQRALFRLCLLSIFICLAVPGHASKEACEAILTNLTPSQIKAVHDAAQTQRPGDSGGFLPAVLHGQVAGLPRTVVLMGEAHFKSIENGIIGAQIADRFDHFGLEGMVPANYFGGRISAWTHKLILDHLRKVSGVDGEYGSTIDDVRRAFIVSPLCREASSPGDDSRSSDDEADDETKDEEPGNKRLITQRGLEDDHRPTFAEQATDLAPAATFAFFGATVATGGYTFARNLLFGQPQEDYAGPAFSYIWKGFAVLQATRWIHAHFDYRHRLKTGYGLDLDRSLRNRDRTMSRNIMKAFEKDPSINTLLVLIGRAHVRGIQQNLVRDFNMQVVDIKDLPLCNEGNATTH